MQNLVIYIDDSGKLHKNKKTKYFIYAGFIFCDEGTANTARRKYRAVSNRIKDQEGLSGEIKACILKNKHKNNLSKVMNNYESFSVLVDVPLVDDQIKSNKKSIQRFKDYTLKRVIKNKLKSLEKNGLIHFDKPTKISIFIDEQPTGTNGLYDLERSIYEELVNGTLNFKYGRFIEPVFASEIEVMVIVKYKDSKYDFLIQSSDILANRIWASYEHDREDLLNIPKHLHLKLP